MLDFFGQKDFYLNYRNEYNQIFNDVLANDSLLRGQSVIDFEDKITELIGRKYAIAVNSGTDAILIALVALGVKPGDEIIVPAFSFIASATPVKMLGAQVIFVDIDTQGFIDVSKIEEAITSSTRGIIVVDIFGECADFSGIYEICNRYNLFFLEDAAQAYGSRHGDKKAGTFGHVSAISFDVSKVVYGVTTAGIILTDNEGLFKKAMLLRGHGFNPTTRDFEIVGYNSNMSSLNAAILSFRVGLDLLLKEKRKAIRVQYDSGLQTIRGLSFLRRNRLSVGNDHKYVVFVDKRNELMNYLLENDIPVKVHYDRPIPHYSSFGLARAYQNAEYFSEHILSLPIHPFLDNEDIAYICRKIRSFYE